MKKVFYFVLPAVVVFCLVWSFSVTVHADEMIGGTLLHAQANVIGYNGDGRAYVATDFTPSVSGSFNSGEVSAQLAAGNRSFYVEIRDDNAGVPSDTVLGTSGLIVPSVASDGCADDSIEPFTLFTTVDVVAATKYWLVIKPSGIDGSTYSRACSGNGTGVGTENFASPDGATATWYDYSSDPVYMLFTISEGVEPTTTPATTTVVTYIDNPNQNFAYGFALFLMSFFGVAFLLRTRV